VDEATWLCSTDPTALLKFLRGKASDRKLRLFAVAWSRRFLHLLHDHRVGEALDIAERFADGLVGDEERSRAQQAAQVRRTVSRPDAPKEQRLAASLAYYAAARHAIEAACMVPGLAVGIPVWRAGGYDVCDWEAIKAEEGLILCNLLRDIFGPLPFRPVALDPPLSRCQDGLVVRLARAAYDERILPEGLLDPARLAVLADALEEAGCTAAEILGHLRGPGPHVRGCHLVDLLVGKE
jgi:hypothetical protein